MPRPLPTVSAFLVVCFLTGAALGQTTSPAPVPSTGETPSAQAAPDPDPDAPPIKIGPVLLTGYIQYDFLAGLGDDAGKVKDAFRFRRVRFQLHGPLSKDVEWAFSVETTGTPSIRDAYVTLKYFPEATIHIGQLVLPYGYERYVESSNRLEFTERPLNNLAPGRDAGVMVTNEEAPFWGWLTYGAAVANGSGQNVADTNSEKDVMGRITVEPPSLKGLEFSVNGVRGEQPAGMRHRMGGDVAFENRRYHVAFEFLRESLDDAAQTEHNGMYVFGSWRLFPKAPRRALHHVELATRYAQILGTAPEVKQMEVAANYYMRRNLRFMVDLIVPTDRQPDDPHATLHMRTNIVF